MGRVLELPQLLKELDRHRPASRVVFTNGCFDILHVGHTRYLQEARTYGDLLVVGVNSDASVKRLKGPKRPIQPQADRAEILAALASVSYVTIFDEDTPAQLIEKISPDVLVKGGDWPVDKIEGAKWVLDHGGEVHSLPFHPGRSTTKLIDRIDGRR